ncbi:hypothetical protein GY45DRAFT_1373175 [Cubamyces sp. BRFM 1775]|nr:hypothetical protein GY45DRAFT_1373175 [Cubamyces sp. BRFM 1775]
MSRFTIATIVFTFALALSAAAGPIPRDAATTTTDAIPPPAFTFAPRPVSDPLPAHPSSSGGIPPMEMDWLS